MTISLSEATPPVEVRDQDEDAPEEVRALRLLLEQYEENARKRLGELRRASLRAAAADEEREDPPTKRVAVPR